METHSDAHARTFGPRVGLERALRVHGGRDGVTGSGEGDEERVALGVDLTPAIRLEGIPQQPLMGLEQLWV
jgi:hypothetical protein